MNKKITTLLASAMLATAFSAGAANKGDAVLLNTGTQDLSAKTGTDFGRLELVTTPTNINTWNLKNLNAATWTISEKKSSLGQTIYSFVNKATGLSLAIDPAIALDADKNGANATTMTLGGSASEWVELGNTLVSYFSGDSVVYIAQNGTGPLYLEKTTKAKLSTGKPVNLSIKTDFPDKLNLDATDLNTLLQSVNAADFFGLNMAPQVTTGQKNLLTATALKAIDVTTTTSGKWVKLQAKDQKKGDDDAFVVVDTAYYDGTETSKLLKFAYDKYNADNRELGSYHYKFTFDAAKQELYIQTEKVVYKLEKTSGTDADFAKLIKEKNNNSYWSVPTGSTAGLSLSTESEMYIYMARLAGTNVLTVNTEKTNKADDGTTNLAQDKVQRTKVTLGTNFTGLIPTTIADGVYTIRYKSTGGHNPEKNGSYALANLAGTFGWANQAKRQDFNHMPAAQWVVKKNGVSNTALVTIDNREFSDLSIDDVLPNNATQFFSVEGSTDVFYYPNNTNVADTLSFVKVADDLVKDTKLGYKYVSTEEALVQTYVFNYLHGLALDKYLYTPAGKDSIVRVDENDGKTNFRLTLVVKDDKYGYGDGLVRNVYYVSDGRGRYISYDEITKKYMMKSIPTPFFLKENNCIDGKHYYALVEAKLVTDNVNPASSGKFFAPDGTELENGKEYPLYTKDGYFIVNDYQKDGYKGYFFKKNSKGELEAYEQCDRTATGTSGVVVGSSKNYANVKVSVDDNTLDLTEGNLNDKFILGNDNEIRTSAFAVSKDDSPLYRRFNNIALGESETADSLFFVEKIRKEYLMDEWNKNLTDKTVDYAGIWNKEKANGKLAFIVDTAWVDRGNGDIKPQYLISVAREDQAGTPGVPCTYEHNHYDNAGNLVDAAHCSHATQGHAGFDYGKYLVSFGDSALIKGHELKVPYMDIDGGYTRVGFVKAIHAGDSLFILTQGFENVDPATLDTATIISAYKKSKSEHFIVNLQGDNHKNVTWSFRYVNPDKAGAVTEEGEANEFLFESNIYNENGLTSTGKATDGFDKAVAGSIAPQYAAWLKMQNGCLVLTRGDSEFNAAKTGSDGALIFNAYQKTDAEDMVTSIEGANAEGVSIVAGNGTVTVQGAAGKSIVITNILGKVVAETVLTSDNATIAVPAGIVAIAIDGEEAVKAIVK